MKKWLAVAGFALAGGGGLAAWTAMPSDERDQTAEEVSVQFEDFDESSAERQAPTPTDRNDDQKTSSSGSRGGTKTAQRAEGDSSSKTKTRAETEVTVLGIERADNERAEDSDKRVRETPEPSHQPMAPAPTEVEDELSGTADVTRLNDNVHAIPENFGGLKKGQLKVGNTAGQKKPNK